MAVHGGATRPFESGIVKDQLFFYVNIYSNMKSIIDLKMLEKILFMIWKKSF